MSTMSTIFIFFDKTTLKSNFVVETLNPLRVIHMILTWIIVWNGSSIRKRKHNFMVGPFQSMVTRGISGKTPQTTSVQHCGSRVVTFQVALTLDLYELYMNIDSSSIFFFMFLFFSKESVSLKLVLQSRRVSGLRRSRNDPDLMFCEF